MLENIENESSLSENMLKYMNENGVIAFANTQSNSSPSCFYNKERDKAFKKNDDSWKLLGL
jgi:hypothetical protein